MRAYTANPSMGVNGDHTGGVVGFINILRGIVDRTRPSKVVIAWEGGGSSRRRALFKDYKANRRPAKLNRFYEDDIPDSDENKTQQVIELTKLLRNLPVTQVYVADVEGDDVIAWLCTSRYREDRKLIISSDKDLYQLLDHRTVVYSLGRKIFITAPDVLRLHHVSVANFALAKALSGDPGDNIPGVPGVGFKTIAKRFPSMVDDEELSVADILDECRVNAEKKHHPKAYDDVLASADLVVRNLKLVDLRNNQMISHHHATKIDGTIDTCQASFNKMGMVRGLISLGITNVDVDGLWGAFRHLAL